MNIPSPFPEYCIEVGGKFGFTAYIVTISRVIYGNSEIHVITSIVRAVDPSSTLLLAWTLSCPTPLLFEASQVIIVT